MVCSSTAASNMVQVSHTAHESTTATQPSMTTPCAVPRPRIHQLRRPRIGLLTMHEQHDLITFGPGIVRFGSLPLPFSPFILPHCAHYCASGILSGFEAGTCS